MGKARKEGIGFSTARVDPCPMVMMADVYPKWSTFTKDDGFFRSTMRFSWENDHDSDWAMASSSQTASQYR